MGVGERQKPRGPTRRRENGVPADVGELCMDMTSSSPISLAVVACKRPLHVEGRRCSLGWKRQWVCVGTWTVHRPPTLLQKI